MTKEELIESIHDKCKQESSGWWIFKSTPTFELTKTDPDSDIQLQEQLPDELSSCSGILVNHTGITIRDKLFSWSEILVTGIKIVRSNEVYLLLGLRSGELVEGIIQVRNLSEVRKFSHIVELFKTKFGEAAATSRKQVIKDKYASHEFTNKFCKSLDDFIIDDQMTVHDLQMLADLNGITLAINAGWYPLVIELVQELNRNGWNKQVRCIKTKYASLRFYSDTGLDEILDKYEERSKTICETCGEPGIVRTRSGWDHVACRREYLESRLRVSVEDDHFTVNDQMFFWKDITNVSLERLDHLDRYHIVRINFFKTSLSGKILTDNELVIFNTAIGFGRFLQNLPTNYRSLNLKFRTYIQDHFTKVDFCEICGYEAVYYDECECCEEFSWHGMTNRLNIHCYTKEEYIKSYQLDWIKDNGELYESQQQNYPKNPAHQIYFAEDDLNY
jgi:hypothetical protein